MSRKEKNSSGVGGRHHAVPRRQELVVREKLRQAMGYHSSGQLAMADHLYREVIELDPLQPDALHWLGVLEGQAGNSGRALGFLERSVKCNPRDPSAWNDLGTAQRVLNRREDALSSYDQALSLAPGFSKVHCDKAAVLHELGRLDEARQSIASALAAEPNGVEALLQSARIHADAGGMVQALSDCVRALALEDSARTQTAFAEVLRRTRFRQPAPELVPIVMRSLSESWGRPNEIGAAAVSLLMQDASVRSGIDRVLATGSGPAGQQAFDSIDLDAMRAVFRHPLIPALLVCALVCDRDLQEFLTASRRALLMRFKDSRAAMTEDEVRFLSALARQCYVNEYVFDVRPEEQQVVDGLSSTLESSLAAGVRPDELSLMMLSAYASLVSIDGVNAVLDWSWPEHVSVILVQQLREPAVERGLYAEIPCITAVEDDVSLAVQSQYEINPYPRWINLPGNLVPTTVDQYLGSRFPRASFRPIGRSNHETDILVAGCGTGQHAIETAQLFRGARVLAIDLSRASLAYALRKTRDMGIDRLEYAQADILRADGINRRFDLVESMGVLHHLGEPLQGWNALLGLLKPGGLMRIGLYSERARQSVVAVRGFIASRGYAPTVQGIRNCRMALLGGEGPSGIGDVLDSPDFHSTSAVRDLLFHVKEHRYTIPRLRSELHALNLEFIGFELDRRVLAHYASQYPGDRTMNDLDCWDEFESRHPSTFAAMYEFWVQKR